MPPHAPILVLLLLSACAAPEPPPIATLPSQSKFEPAPTPSFHYNRQGVPTRFIELPPRMPPGTGAIPTNGSPFRGSVTTGFKQAF